LSPAKTRFREALEDLALMLSMPTFNVVFPADAVECEQAIEAAARTQGPFYIRALRPKTAVLFGESYRFDSGVAGCTTAATSR
jgi:transketolase